MEHAQVQVEEFMKGCGFEIPDRPKWPDAEKIELCKKLIHEEINVELIGDAVANGDMPKAIDGICDGIFVLIFLASSMGVDLEPFWDEVCKTNLAKTHGPKDPVTGKQLKPPGWVPPQINAILQKQLLQP